jgi:SUMO ligase MMS21 Smc5/6 complex component
MDLVRFAELLNSQGELRDLWVRQKLAERRERSRRVRESQKAKIKNKLLA